MAKRGRLEIMKDILKTVQESKSIKITPLLRKSNLSSKRFYKYLDELLDKRFIKKIKGRNGRIFSLTDRGFKFLEKYKIIINFVSEFDL